MIGLLLCAVAIGAADVDLKAELAAAKAGKVAALKSAQETAPGERRVVNTEGRIIYYFATAKAKREAVARLEARIKEAKSPKPKAEEKPAAKEKQKPYLLPERMQVDQLGEFVAPPGVSEFQVRIVEVLDADTMICRCEYVVEGYRAVGNRAVKDFTETKSGQFVVHGVSTKNYVDDRVITLEGKFRVWGTRKIPSGKTVFEVRPER